MDRTLKAVYVWIVLALIWMGLELLLYGEIQPRTVDDIMWFLFLPFIYMAVNYFCGKDTDLDKLVDAGYMECCEDIAHGEKFKTYWFNRNGLDWLGEQIGVYIRDEEN